MSTTKKIMEIMKDHIGKENAINRYDLFEEVFGHSFKANSLSDLQNMTAMKTATRTIRCNTTCFIVNDDGYYVMSNKTEHGVYSQQLENVRLRLKRMGAQSNKALAERWHTKEWSRLSQAALKRKD